MIVPSQDPALDVFDFHQSSNRMPIECFFESKTFLTLQVKARYRLASARSARFLPYASYSFIVHAEDALNAYTIKARHTVARWLRKGGSVEKHWSLLLPRSGACLAARPLAWLPAIAHSLPTYTGRPR